MKDTTGVIFNLLAKIRDAAFECVSETTLGAPAGKIVYLSYPPADCCDRLAVWPIRISRTSDFPIESRGANPCNDMEMIQVKIRIYRDCWPSVNDNAKNPFPSDEEMEKASMHMMIDAEALMNCAKAGFGQFHRCNEIAVLDLNFDTPSGGCASVTLTAWVMLDGCC